MNVEVTSADGTQTFEARKVLEPGEIGKLDRVGLDRSGRTGGDGIFDDFVMVLGSR